jgi:hypothetical protein
MLRCLSFGLLLALVTSARGQSPSEVFPKRFEIAGLHEGRQLVITATRDGKPADLTRHAKYVVADRRIVEVSDSGFVRALAQGRTTIAVEVGGQRSSIDVEVREEDTRKPLHFTNDILPLLTRHGCNSGGCHGRASGQNNFRLSLFGFDSDFDYNALVKEARGRRVFPASPEESLLLTKATGRAPHGGGKRVPLDSEDYRTLRRWVAQGAPVGDSNAPTLDKIQVFPGQRVLDRKAEQQIAVIASYSDGTVRDVTRQAQYQSNEIGVAAVDPDGLVRTFDHAGEAAVMARYMGKVAVFRALVPLGKAIARYPAFPANNYIDELALARWKKLGLVPSELCADHEFQRRVTVDLIGRLPTPIEVAAFEKDKSPSRRSKVIDRLLDDPDYATFSAMRWGTILRNSSRAGAEQAAYAFHEWLRDLFARNRPYDELVRGVVAAAGEWQDAPAINWFWQMRDDQLHQPVADTAQVFLGLRLQCAKCHHHPYERWGQDDYYGLAGFFTRLGRKGGLSEPPPYYSARTRTISEIHPRTGKPVEPKLLDGPVLTVSNDEDPRQLLVDWMAKPENPFFARAFVNRTWAHLFGRGIVDPVDDMRETNPPSNPELLDALAKDFVRHKFDVKHLMRTLCNSRTYQLSSIPNEYNKHDQQNFARAGGRRLIAEVLHDAIDQVCGVRTEFSKMSKSARAIDLPHDEFNSYFLEVFDRPIRNTGCECARSNEANLSQVLHLANSSVIEGKITSGKGRVAAWLKKKIEVDDAIEEIYRVALARRPTADELKFAHDYVVREPDRKKGFEDLMWAMLNTKEFLFNH